MAQLDTRIAMSGQPLDVAGSLGRGFQLRDLAAQADARQADTQLRQQEAQAKQQAQQREQIRQTKLSDLVRMNTTGGKTNYSAVNQGLADSGYGADIPAYKKQYSEAEHSEIKYIAENHDRIVKMLGESSKTIASLLANPSTTADDVVMAISGMVHAGLLDQQIGAKMTREIPPDPRQLRLYLQTNAARAQQAKDMLTVALPQLQAINLGGTTQLVDTNPLTNPGAAGQTLQRTATPGELETGRHNRASEGLTARGQNLTDARARDANATQKSLLQQERQLKVDELQDKADQRTRTKQSGLSAITNQIAVIDKALDHPGRATATGGSGTFHPANYLPGTDATDFRVVLDQIGGASFLQAFESLKGGGAITEVEGKKATDAIARLSRSQSDEEFEKSLGELRSVMAAGYERASGQKAPERPPKPVNPKRSTVNGRLRQEAPAATAPGGWNIERVQ